MTPSTMKNGDVFQRDLVLWSIPNLGVAKVTRPERSEEWDVLRYELTSFVCEGEYARGLERILSSFLGQLNQPQQPAVWISGFYGSGKSHLARVLEALWRDIRFPDGACARALVRVPPDIEALLHELDTAGRRAGGLWSAAGMLGAGAGQSVRLALLGIVFRAAGLPSQYDRASFLLWLREKGYEQAVRAHLESRGHTLERELPHLAVSTVLAEAVLAADPNLASTPQDATNLLASRFTAPDDISDDDLVELIDRVLARETTTPGRRPLTLLIFDELQQYIGDDPQRALQVQQVVEACSARFGSSVLFVATGQAALGSTPQLQKLQDRFRVRVTLEDKDVERVVREVVLRKKPDAVPALQAALDAVSGEISRHLADSAIGAREADRDDLVPDYPLLPTRRRFWEVVLRAVDPTGTGAQLRNQLRLVHEATREVANQPLGHVIGADAIYHQLQADMLQSGVLLRELHQFISELNDGTPDGLLRSRLCALIFLISKLPPSGPTAPRVRATDTALADLLVTDLPAGSTELRRRVPELLDELVQQGKLLKTDGEYRLQTREGMEWDQAFRRYFQRLLADETRIADERASAIRAALEDVVRGITLTHGTSRTPRNIDLHLGQERPERTGGIPVWVRDEWDVTGKTVQEEARAAGVDDPTVFVFLPRRDAEAVKTCILRILAARETLDSRPNPATDEARQARAAMQSRLDGEQERLKQLIEHILEGASVYQGGGNQVAEASLGAAIRKAAEASLARLFPKFALADHTSWATVTKRAAEGNPSGALSAVGYDGDVADHQACKEVLAWIGGTTKRGSEIRKRFMGPPYGWPQDAVDAILTLLTAAGHLRASRNGTAVTAAGLNRQQIPATDFTGEEITITKGQWIAVRGLLQHAGFLVRTDDEARAQISAFLDRLIQLAHEAGGEPPLPLRPDVSRLRDVRTLTGNEQIVAVYEERDRLKADFDAWSQASAKIKERLPRWQRFERLLQHAAGLDIARVLEPQVQAIRENRALLSDPDPVAPLHEQVTRALREALQEARERLVREREQELAALEQTGEWGQLAEPDRQGILHQEGLDPVADIDVSTDEALLRTLDAQPLREWQARLDALPARADRAREAAARLLMPETVRVHVPEATFRTPAEVDAYLAALRAEILRHIEAGHPVLV